MKEHFGSWHSPQIFSDGIEKHWLTTFTTLFALFVFLLAALDLIHDDALQKITLKLK